MFIKKITLSTVKSPEDYKQKFLELKKKLTDETKNFKNVDLAAYNKILKQNNPYFKMIQILKDKLKTEYITNAYIKMRELLVHFGNKLNFNQCMHAAEFPGSFIKCIEYYCNENKLTYSWHANSYLKLKNSKSFYLDDKFQLYKNNPNKWLFGAFNDGDITRLDNLRSLKQDLTVLCNIAGTASTVSNGNAGVIGTAGVTFVTGDAKVILGTTEDDWDNEELTNTAVIYSETILALSLLNTNGSAIIKFFTFCDIKTLYIIYNIFNHFEEVYITKPITSRPANSEMYLVCIKKNKDFNEEFLYDVLNCPFIKIPDISIPNEFLQSIYKIEEELITTQISALKKNLTLEVIKYNNEIEDWLKINFATP